MSRHARSVVLSVPRRRWLTWSLTTLALAGAALWSAPQLAHARSVPTVVEAVQLPAWLERNGQRRPAQAGVALREGDKAITAKQARMLLRLADNSEMKIGENTELLVEGMRLTGSGVAQPKHIKTALRLITGVFWYATDVASELAGNKRELNLRMATATVGIRGTEFWSMTDADHDAVCVFDGTVAVTRADQPEISLDKPGAFWVTYTGQPQKPAGQATPDQLAKFIGQAEFMPGSGVLVQGGRWRAVLALTSTSVQAGALRDQLAALGYPAEVRPKDGKFEVRINQFATEQDARSVVERLNAQADLKLKDARVALAAP